MTPDLRLLSGFARGVSVSLHVRVTCLHSGLWLRTGLIRARGDNVCLSPCLTLKYLNFNSGDLCMFGFMNRVPTLSSPASICPTLDPQPSNSAV